MRCINKGVRFFALLVCMSLVICACAEEPAIDFNRKYDVNNTLTGMGQTIADSSAYPYFADELCVGEDIFTQNDAVTDRVTEAVGLFDLTSKQIVYSKNIYKKLYPASITKVMTAYLALKYGKLSDTVTVSALAVDQPSDSSVCGLEEGNTLSLQDLLFGLMLRSGNDAAIVIAEHISGSVEEFAELMNKEAAALGATGTHFVNPNGLHSEEHFTTLYDIYLIFNAAMEQEGFNKIVGTAYYEPKVKRADGSDRDLRWTNTNKYINGDVMAPEGVNIQGGKTGTTNAAGYCLTVKGVNSEGHDIIAIVLKADCRENLYYVMNQVLTLA